MNFIENLSSIFKEQCLYNIDEENYYNKNIDKMQTKKEAENWLLTEFSDLYTTFQEHIVKPKKIINYEEYVGKKYNKLTILKFIGKNKYRQKTVEVQCDCEKATVFITAFHSLKSGNTKTCGCGSGNKEYNTYNLTSDYGIGYDRKGIEFYFDLEDYNLIKDISWSVIKNRVIGSFNGKAKDMSKVLTNTSSEIIDHINLNPRDNRRKNLREVTQQQNTFNRRGHGKLAKFGVKGVSWAKSNKKWIGQIKKSGEYVYKKYFTNVSDAVISQIEAEKEFIPECRYAWEHEINWENLLNYEKEIKELNNIKDKSI